MGAWLDDLVADGGSLVAVKGQRAGPDAYAVLEFTFARRALRLRCDPDADEVIIEPASEADVVLDDLTADAVFADLRGKVIEYAWCLTNHRCYRDAFQMRFLDLGDRAEETRQFEVAASAMRVLRVSD